MKRIISSLGVAGFALSVLMIGATGAFFSDTEASSGNVFTAGTIDLELDSFGHIFNGAFVSDGWLAGQSYGKFFDFRTFVPGDRGVRHLSLHNDSSDDAYVCLLSDPTTDTHNAGTEINAFMWRDNTQDGKYDPTGGESAITPSPISIKDLDGYAYADSDEGVPLGTTNPSFNGNLAVAWCAGTMTLNPSGDPDIFPGEPGSNILCDGAGMTTQGGSYIADITLYAEQVSNNGSFQCNGLSTAVVPVAPSNLATSPSGLSSAPNSWLFYNDSNDTIMSINQFGGSGGVNDIVNFSGTGAAQMTLHDSSARYNIATYKYKDVKLADIATLSYRIYDASPSSQTPFLHFNVDFNNSDTWQRRLVQVPTGITSGNWTTVNALSGMWTLSGGNWPVGVNTTVPFSGSTPRTWASIVADYPIAETRSTDSFFGIRVGHPGPGTETSYVDWINFNGELTNFGN